MLSVPNVSDVSLPGNLEIEKGEPLGGKDFMGGIIYVAGRKVGNGLRVRKNGSGFHATAGWCNGSGLDSSQKIAILINIELFVEQN